MRNQIQRELDRAEEYVLTALFGDIDKPIISNKLKLILVAKGIDFDKFINNKIAIFEEFSKEFMDEDGFYIGEKLSRAIATRFPILAGMEIPNIKPIDLFKMLDNVIGLEQLGQIIQKL